MKDLFLLNKLLLRASINKWQGRNNLYRIFTVFVIVFLGIQLSSLNVRENHLFNIDNNWHFYIFLDYIITLIFILWILSPFIFGIKLSATRDFSEFRYLPIKRYIFILYNNILSFIGIGPLMTIYFVYQELLKNLAVDWIIFLQIFSLLLFYINVSGLVGFFLLTFNLGGRYNKIIFAGLFVFVLLLIGTPFISDSNEIISLDHLMKIFPPKLLISGIIGIHSGEISRYYAAFLGLGCYAMLANYLYVKIQNHAAKSVNRLAITGSKLKVYPSLFSSLNYFLKYIFPDAKLRMFLVKDMVYFLMNRRLLVWYMLQLFAAYLLFGFFLKNFPNPYGAIVIMISLLGVLNLSLYMNVFAFESAGIQSYFFYPVYFYAVFLSKNLANTLISLILMIFSFLILTLKTDILMHWYRWAILFFSYIYVNLFSQSCGNLFSIYFVTGVPYTKSTGLFNPYAAILVSIVIIILAVIPSISLVYFQVTENFMFVLTLGLLGISLFTYRYCLNYTSKLILIKRMILLNELV